MLARETLELMHKIYVEAMVRGGAPVDPSCGRFLYIMTRALAELKPIRAVEVGAGYGLSTLWIALGLADSKHKGTLYSLEVKEDRARVAEGNLALLGLSSYVRVIVADALSILPGLEGHFHMAFLNGRKEQYALYLDALSPKMPEGSILMAHNVIGPRPYKVSDFLAKVMGTDEWLTAMLPVDPDGLSVSIKLRASGRPASEPLRSSSSWLTLH